MAYSDYPDYSSAFKKVSELGLKLYGAKDRRDIGLAAQMDRIANKFGEDSPQFKKAKAEFDKMQKEYNDAEAKLSSIKATIDSKEKSSKKAKENEKKKKKDASTIQRLEYERDSLRRQNKTDEADAKQKEIDAIKNPASVQEGKSVKMTNAQMLDNYLASASTTIGSSGPVVQVTEPNKLDPRGNPTVYEAFLYVEPGTKGSAAYEGSQLVQKPGTEKGVEFGTADVIRDKYIKQLIKQYGSKQALVDRLKEVGLLTTNKNVPSGAIDTALNQIIAEYTYEQTSAYKNYGVRDFPTLDEYMSNRPKGSGSTTTTRTTVFSDTDFRGLAQEVGRTILQRELSPEELKKLQPILEKAQRRTPEVTTTTPGADGNAKAISTRTGLNSQQFLIEELAKTDEAKATQMIGFYDVYKQMMGVQ